MKTASLVLAVAICACSSAQPPAPTPAPAPVASEVTRGLFRLSAPLETKLRSGERIGLRLRKDGSEVGSCSMAYDSWNEIFRVASPRKSSASSLEDVALIACLKPDAGRTAPIAVEEVE